MRTLPIALLTAAVLAACGDSSAPTKATATAAATATATAASTAPPKPKGDEPLSLTVDEMGPYLQGRRASLKEQGGAEMLKAIVAELPVKGRDLELVVLKKAKVPDVVAAVRELGAAGAKSIKIKADARNDLPEVLPTVPLRGLGEKPPACSLVVMITAKLETDVWSLGGGAAKMHKKGFAGPDLSNAGESIAKELKRCDSKYAFFAADSSLAWEHAHMAGGALLANDKDKKLAQLVLLTDEEPVPGRPIKGL
jgi:biopolymer transport protein ExbD